MITRYSIGTVVVLAVALSAARGQDTSTPQTTDPPATGASTDTNPQQEPGTPPTPAYGQENPPLPITENPPISGLDLPGLESHGAPLSYLQPGVHISESVDSNVSDALGGSRVRSITRAFGSLTLQRLWSNYDLALDYVGGVGYYDAPGLGAKLVQALNVNQKIKWKRGQLTLRDNFSYLPEGNFGLAYGSLGSQQNLLGGGFLGGGAFGSLGQVPRITNLSAAEISQSLSPKSAITLTGGYGFMHFTGTGAQGISYLGSSQASVQAGYNRTISRHDQIALVYGYQGFRFSPIAGAGTAFHTQVVQVMYGHRISGRMDFLAGAGPQITSITNFTLFGPVGTNRVSVAGRASLRYRFPKTSLDLAFERYTTSGSGLFAGAQSNTVRLAANRPITRVWNGFVDVGYSHNSRLQPAASGVNAKNYGFGFAGFGARRPLGRNFGVFASYQFNELYFDSSFCSGLSPCSRTSQRHVGTFGFDWTPRPIRID
jgi:hypothetical protein